MLEELGSTFIRIRTTRDLRPGKTLRTPSQLKLAFLLVTTHKDFYNPPKTALETVVTFIRMPNGQPESTMVEHSLSECLKIHSIVSTSQEH